MSCFSPNHDCSALMKWPNSNQFANTVIVCTSSLSLSACQPNERTWNLLEKLRLIKESKTKSQRNLASQFGISVGAVNNILKRNREYENLGEENYNQNVKRLKRSTNEDVNELTWQWFVTARSKNMIVSKYIQAKALELASQQHLPDISHPSWVNTPA